MSTNPEQQQKKDIKKDQKSKYTRLVQQYLKFDHPALNIKHKSCQHENGCLTQLIDLSFRGFAVGFLTKSALNLVLLLLKKPALLLKKPWLLIMIFFNKETFNFGLFPCVYNTVLQATTCLLRHLRNRSKDSKQSKFDAFIDPFVSGFLAGFISLWTKPKNARAIWGLFLITRAFECGYNSLINRGYIPDSQFNWIFIFSLMWINQGYNIAMETGNCPPSFVKFIGTQMNQDVGDYTLNIAWLKKKNNELKAYYGDFVPAYDPLVYLKKPTKQVNLFGFKS